MEGKKKREVVVISVKPEIKGMLKELKERGYRMSTHISAYITEFYNRHTNDDIYGMNGGTSKDDF